MDFMDFLNEANKNNATKKEKVVGRMTSALRTEFREFINNKDHLTSTYEIRKKQVLLDAQEKLQDEFQTRFDSLADTHDRVWNKIYMEFDLDPNGRYSYDRETNEIISHNGHNEDERSANFH